MPLARDLRYGIRALRKTPAFTLGAILTVALSVGATTAIFSVVYGVLLRQLPYRDVERVFWIWSDRVGRDRAPFNVPDFIDYRSTTRTLSGFAGFFNFSANLSDESAAERLQGIRATGNFFDVIGARAVAGRLLQASDEEPGAGRVVVLSEPLWKRRFGGDERIVGQTIRLNGEERTVVGVLAPGFVTPIRDVEFVMPFAPGQDPRRGARNSVNFIIGVGRLAENTSRAQALSELTAIAQRLQQQFPVNNASKRGVHLFPVLDGIVGPFRTALLTVFAAVGAVLLIACGNLANLMLTRATSRRKEIAIQLALGSARSRVVRQVLVDAMLIGGAGGALGVLLAYWGVKGLVAAAPADLPRTGEIRLDVAVLIFSLTASLLTSLLFGAIPALTSSHVNVRDSLQGETRSTTGGGMRIRGALVSAEVAIAVVLLIVMTLLARSFANVQAVSPGFDPAGALSARLTLPATRYNTRARILTFQRSLTEQISALPAVTHAGAISLLPLSGLLSRVPFTVDGRAVDRDRIPITHYRIVTSGYFAAAGIPLTRGRTFSDGDSETAPAVGIVSEELARHWLQGLESIGARLLINDNDTGPRPVEIVGVVANVQQMTLDTGPTADLYLPYPQFHTNNTDAMAANMFWVVRTPGDPMVLAPGFAREVRRLDPEVAASQIRPLDRYLSDAVAPRRFSLFLMTAFAVAALVLAVTGIYAVVAYSVSQRRRELGIRLALGASRARIGGLVLGQGLRFVIIGAGVGALMAAGSARLIAAMLFGVPATDTATFVQATIVVIGISIAACVIPMARAGRIGVSALKAE